MNDEEIKELIKKYLNGTANAEETGMLESWYAHQAASTSDGIENTEVRESLQRIAEGLPLKRPVYRRINWPRIAAAIALLLLVGAGGYFWISGSNKPNRTETGIVADIAPGGNRATLTLSNGQTIALSEDQSGIIVGDENINYQDGSALAIISNDKEQGGGLPAGRQEYPTQLTLSTPRGGQYQVQLPDGTKVWLNAASSLSYPASFAGQAERRVELIGEAYFEVAKNKKQPFIVRTDQQQVEVLGTHFNINSYSNEQAVKTTLLEGSVKVSPALPAGGGGQASHLPVRQAGILLTPGQQAILSGAKIKVIEVVVEDAVAWKNGVFVFSNEPLESIMRKVARWYNVEVVFKDKAAGQEVFWGSVSRFKNVSELLSMLEETGNVRFKIEKRKIIVQTKTEK